MKPFIVVALIIFSIQAHSGPLVTDSGTVYPFFAGTVSGTGFEPICSDGNLEQTAQVKFIAIESDNGVRIKYKGLDRVFVEVGTQVDPTTALGHIISTSRVKPPPHLEVQLVDGTPISMPTFCSLK